MTDKLITLSNLSRFKEKLDLLYEKIQHAADTYVQKESGKGLSTNDYTDAEKTKLAGIESGAQVNVKPDWNAAAGNAAEILNKPTIPTVNNATLTIKRNNTSVGTFTANDDTDTEVNISVPTTATEVGALPDTTKYGASASLTIDDHGTSATYVVTLQLKDQDGNNLGTAQTIDLPLESMVVDGDYDTTTQEVVLTLKNGNEVRFSVADLVSGLQTELSSTNKLDADYVDDANSTNKFVTAAEKTKLAGIAPGAEVNVQADWSESDSTSDAYIANKPQNLVQDANYVHTDNNYITAEKTKLAGIGVTVNGGTKASADANGDITLTIPLEGLNNVTITNVADGQVLMWDATNSVWKNANTVSANDGTLTVQKNGTQVGTFTANQSTNTTINIEETMTGISVVTGSTDSSADAAIVNQKAQLIVASQSDIDALFTAQSGS